METDEVISVPLVFSTITHAFSFDNAVRNNADSQLKRWEEDAVPGFLASLLTIAEQTPDEVRGGHRVLSYDLMITVPICNALFVYVASGCFNVAGSSAAGDRRRKERGWIVMAKDTGHT